MITILSESTNNVLTPLGFLLIFFGSMSCIISLILVFEGYAKHSIFPLFIGIVMIGIAIVFCHKPETEVKATLSEDYPVTKLFDTYDVIDRDGDIWILIEKETEVQ